MRASEVISPTSIRTSRLYHQPAWSEQNVGTGEVRLSVSVAFHDGITQIIDNGYDNIEPSSRPSSTSL